MNSRFSNLAIASVAAKLFIIALVISGCSKDINDEASNSTTDQSNSGVDNTPPVINTSNPAGNNASVAVNSIITVTFSEAMTPSSITAATFNLKQGNTAISGNVTYSGNVATFTPSSLLTAGTVYSATVTTGVKDIAGNAIAANYSWSFTTASTIAALSFTTDIIPVLTQCNNCHRHGWTTSTAASTFYTNLVSGGYVNAATPSSGKIYSKLSSGHASPTISSADINKILTWMNAGSKNN